MATRRRLIAGCINRYPAEEGWENVHLDKSGRALFDLERNRRGEPAEIVCDLVDLVDLPPADRGGSFDEVRCWQVLEHLTPSQAPRALEGFWRVLNPGGTLDLEVPDVAAIVNGWHRGDLGWVDMLRNLYGSESPAMPDDHYNAHRWGWSEATLHDALVLAGFEPGRRVEAEYQLRLIARRPCA